MRERIGIVECHRVRHHRSAGLRRRDVVGPLVGRRVWTKTPTAWGSGEPRASVAERHVECGGVIDGRGGWARRLGAAANGAGEYGFVHPLRFAIHGVGPRGCTLVVLARAGARSAGVVVVDVATVGVAIIPVLKTFDWRRGVGSPGGIAVSADGGIVVSAAATTMVRIAAVVEGGGTILRRVVAAAVVVAAVISVVAAATATLTTTSAARVAPLPALSGGSGELDHASGGLLSYHVAEHLELPLHCVDGRC